MPTQGRGVRPSGAGTPQPASKANPARGRTYRVKLTLVGDVGVGKTSILHRFLDDEFDERYVSTLGAKVSTKAIELNSADGGPVTIDLALWDIMGLESFIDFMGEAYFAGAQGIIAVCDLTRPETLTNLDRWVERASRTAPGVPVVVIANKADVERDRRISDADLEEFCRRRGWELFVGSARSGVRVKDALRRLSARAARASPPSTTVSVGTAVTA